MRLSAILATALLTSVAVAQVALPPHATVYNGFSRGFNFTAATAFTIIGLDLPTDAFQAGDTAGYLVRINGATAFRSVGNAGAIAANLPIVPGDVVDIIGNWSPATTGNFSAHNSYGAGPFATTIEGVPHTITRCGWQWDIGAPAWVDTGTTGTYLAPTTGQLGRVIMFTSSGGSGTVLATNTTLGAGCGQSAASVYESFATSAAFDLSNTGFSMVPTGSGYVVLPATTTYLAPSGGATVLTLGDDTEAPVALTGTFSYPGGSTSSLAVCSNGYVSVASGNGTAWTPVVATFLNAPQTGWWNWHDYNPTMAGSGQVKFEQIGSIAYVTWDGVYDHLGTTVADANTFQFQFDTATGQVHVHFQTMSAGGNARLVGYSPGGNSLDPGSTDLSAAIPGSITLAGADASALALAATSRPITNTSWGLSVSNIPANGTIGVDVFGLTDPNIADLGFLGLPGCGLRASLDVLNAWLVAGSTHTYSLPIPNNPALLNLHVYTTSAVFQSPPTNPFGAITSNGIDGKIGDF